MIKLENLNKYYNRHKKNEIHVINNTSLELGNTGLVALLGPSGCGKTTLLNAIGGLDKVTSGKIYINGKKLPRNCNKIDKIRNMNIGYIFQDYYLVDNLSVYDNVALALKICGIKDKEEIQKRVNYVLEKVGMYRYRNRYANMLSGGERQRVGIARAIVKDPNIIIADEPTGNLDSRNTIEVMNIIKAISKDRLVILVTHERELADFYASRILEIEDGTIKNDIDNHHTNDLDYRLDNKIYLMDFKNHEIIEKNDIKINYYSNDTNKLNINIVVQNGNIYIEQKDSNKIEVIDNDSTVELVNDHYKKIDKSIYEEYNFDFNQIINKDIKKKYSSIFNPISLISNGFKKVRDYSFIKKILLLGFFASGMFITYSISSLFGVTNIKDENFVSINKNYLTVIVNKIKVDEFKSYEENQNIDYVLPGDSIIYFKIQFDDYYQSLYNQAYLYGSISSINMITKSDLILGRMPENDYEIVVDKMVLNKLLSDGESNAKYIGITSYDQLINREVSLENMKNFKIVGITDLNSPSIYANENMFTNMILNNYNSDEYTYYDDIINSNDDESLKDYDLVKDEITLKKGRYPTNDYEVIINYNLKDVYDLSKKIDYEVNGTKLKVVGYYTSEKNIQNYLVSNTTMKYYLITNSSNITIYPKDKNQVLNEYKEKKVNIQDSYEYSKKTYIEERKESIKSSLIACLIVLIISIIEIYLMIRASFLSRIKEVGIYRAIGVKKTDIYKMFIGEIIAITTLSSFVGVILMSYIIKQLSFISYMSSKFMMNTSIFILIMIIVYLLNLIIGLLPVYKVIRKTPAQIMSRSDI
jgi:putative ABC transport system permease protein